MGETIIISSRYVPTSVIETDININVCLFIGIGIPDSFQNRDELDIVRLSLLRNKK